VNQVLYVYEENRQDNMDVNLLLLPQHGQRR